MHTMRYWIASCPCCGEVKIAKETTPERCPEEVRTGPRSGRQCRSILTNQIDVTEKVLAALAAKKAAKHTGGIA